MIQVMLALMTTAFMTYVRARVRISLTDDANPVDDVEMLLVCFWISYILLLVQQPTVAIFWTSSMLLPSMPRKPWVHEIALCAFYTVCYAVVIYTPW